MSAFIYTRRYCDPTVLTYQTSRMPEQIRLKVGGPTNGQFSVYDEFARNIPGFQPLAERDVGIPKVTLPVSDCISLRILLIAYYVIMNFKNNFRKRHQFYLSMKLLPKLHKLPKPLMLFMEPYLVRMTSVTYLKKSAIKWKHF